MAAQMAVQENTVVGNITAKIQAMNHEVEQLERAVRTGTVDVRVLVEFREAMNHARRATSAVQKWVEEEAKKGDPFQAVQFVMANACASPPSSSTTWRATWNAVTWILVPLASAACTRA
jgi:hypothetical protein